MIKSIISEIKINIKARITAKPFDIYREKLCSKKEADGYWLANDGYLYYGCRWGVFFFTEQNQWYKDKEYQKFRTMISDEELQRFIDSKS